MRLHSVLQMQQRRSSQMKRRRATQVEQTSRCKQGPYATHSNGSAQTAQQSSMSSYFQTLISMPRSIHERWLLLQLGED